jgi:hypothetical protein
VPVTTVAPTPETVKPSLSCPPGKTVRVYAASRTRMCVLPKATASEGLLWNAIGQQVSREQGQLQDAQKPNPHQMPVLRSKLLTVSLGPHCICCPHAGQLQPSRGLSCGTLP